MNASAALIVALFSRPTPKFPGFALFPGRQIKKSRSEESGGYTAPQSAAVEEETASGEL
jgi:hypothetical protein